MTGLRILAGVFAALTTVVAAEALDRPTGESEKPAVSAPQAPAAPAAAAAPDTGRIEAWSAALLARPLFAPDRRPLPKAAGPAAVQEAALPRLSGIVSSPNLRFAIFEEEHAAHAMVVVNGGTVGGWKVTAIDENSVTLARDNSQPVTLRPRYASGAMVAAAVPPPRPTPVSRWVNPAATGILRTRWANPHLQP